MCLKEIFFVTEEASFLTEIYVKVWKKVSQVPVFICLFFRELHSFCQFCLPIIKQNMFIVITLDPSMRCFVMFHVKHPAKNSKGGEL